MEKQKPDENVIVLENGESCPHCGYKRYINLWHKCKGDKRQLYTLEVTEAVAELSCEICETTKVMSLIHKCKRGVDCIQKYVKIDETIKTVLEAEPPNYVLASEKKQTRDKALLALLLLTGLRISEILSIQKQQFDFDEVNNFVMIRHIRVLKKRDKKIFVDKPLALTGKLAPITELVLKQLDYVEKPTDYVIPLGRRQAYGIVNKMTGKWCHYFRSQKISQLINQERLRVIEVAEDFQVRPETIAHYFKSSWKEHKGAYKPE